MVQQFMQKNCIKSILLKKNKKNCLSLHYNGANSYLFVNGTEIHKFKAKDSEKHSRKHFKRLFCR